MCIKQFFLLLSIGFLTKTAFTSDVDRCKLSTISTILREDTQRILEKEIEQLVECVRQLIKNGIAGVSLDPFQFPIFPLYLETNLFSSSMWLTNINFEGLASFILDKGTININLLPPQVVGEIALSFGQIKLATNYNGNMELVKFLRLFGRGSFSIVLDHLKVSLRVVIDVLSLSLQEIKVHLELPSTKADVTGLFNDDYMSVLIGRQITDTFTQLAEEQENNLNNLINDFLQQLLMMRSKDFTTDSSFDEIVQTINDDGFTCGASLRFLDNFFTQTINLKSYLNSYYNFYPL